jgi:hypothetical protein
MKGRRQTMLAQIMQAASSIALGFLRFGSLVFLMERIGG